MIPLLKHAALWLAAAIAALILVVISREIFRSITKRRWERKLDRCRRFVGRIDHLRGEEIEGLALELKKLFPLPLLEEVLDGYAKGAKEQAAGDAEEEAQVRKNLLSIYDRLGFVEHHLHALQEAKSWVNRAAAAETLGKIGHARAVLPLVKVLQDATEEREVKNAAMRALGIIRDERAVMPLIDILALPNLSVGAPVADVLVQFGRASAEPLIGALASSKNESQRFWAAHPSVLFGAPNGTPLRHHSPKKPKPLASTPGTRIRNRSAHTTRGRCSTAACRTRFQPGETPKRKGATWPLFFSALPTGLEPVS